MKPLSQLQTGLDAMAIAVPFIVLFSLAAAAQDQGTGPAGRTLMAPAPATGSPAQQAAPPGHRQPTMGGLPPKIRSEEETAGNRARDDLGPMQSICSKC